jgi:hypothetical protein
MNIKEFKEEIRKGVRGPARVTLEVEDEIYDVCDIEPVSGSDDIIITARRFSSTFNGVTIGQFFSVLQPLITEDEAELQIFVDHPRYPAYFSVDCVDTTPDTGTVIRIHAGEVICVG